MKIYELKIGTQVATDDHRWNVAKHEYPYTYLKRGVASKRVASMSDVYKVDGVFIVVKKHFKRKPKNTVKFKGLSITNPEVALRREKNRKIRHRRERALGMSLEQWRIVKRRVVERDYRRCVWCKSKEDLTVDHIVPLKDGGTNDMSNLRTLCLKCHTKYNRLVGH